MLCEHVCWTPITYRCRELRSSCLTLPDLRKRLSLMVLAVANDSMQGFSCWLPRLIMVGIASKVQEDLSLCCTAVVCLESWCWWRSVLLSPVCSLQSSRFACRPRMLLHDCRQLAANVRAFVDFSLGDVCHLFMVSDEDFVY